MLNIYYINLDRSPDRKVYMEAQLKGIPHKRIAAIDGNISSNVLDIIEIPKNNRTEYKYIATLASHFKAIKTAYENKLEEVIISEDDIDYTILNKTSHKLMHIWNKSNCDLLQIHSSSSHAIENLYIPVLETKTVQLINKNANNITYWGATCYIINKSGMEKVMKLYNYNTHKFDIRPFYKWKLLSDILLYIICKSKVINIPFVNICNPTLLKSTIQTNMHVHQLQMPAYTFIETHKKAFMNILNTDSENMVDVDIPKIIHQTWKDNDIPYKKLNSLLKNLHPNWEFKLWTDTSMGVFIETHYPKYTNIYNSFPKIIQKCDFFRYLIVYHYGGFYLDLDIVIYKKLDDLLENELCLFNEKILSKKQCQEHNHPFKENQRVANYAFGAIPKNPFLLHVINTIANNDNSNVTCANSVLETTGPGLLTRLFHNKIPCTLIYPTEKSNTKYTCSCQDSKSCRVGNYGNHLHMGSWRNIKSNIINIIIETINDLNIEMPTPKYTENIINYIRKKYPTISKLTIQTGLRKYWLTP